MARALSHCMMSKVKNNTASIDDVMRARTRELPASYTIPDRTFKIASFTPSYASLRGWNKGELL